MKLILSLCSIITLALLWSYKPAQKKPVNLEGSWEIVSYIDHESGGTEWLTYGPEIIKQKHITPTHFNWIMYDKDRDMLIGLGGGTYKIDEAGNYIENIDYFYPPGSSELGQSIPFTVDFKKGNWYHTGYAKRMEINGLGLIISTDSVKIEEIWSPIIPKYDNKKGLIGSWTLETFRHKSDEPYQDYPKYMGYLKMLTSTHFVWIQYNKEGDEIFAAGSGPYQYDGKSYIETLNVIHPSDDPVKDKTIVFEIELSDYKWKHFGYVPRDDGMPDSDDNMIDEFWIPYSADIDDETAFIE